MTPPTPRGATSGQVASSPGVTLARVSEAFLSRSPRPTHQRGSSTERGVGRASSGTIGPLYSPCLVPGPRPSPATNHLPQDSRVLPTRPRVRMVSSCPGAGGTPTADPLSVSTLLSSVATTRSVSLSTLRDRKGRVSWELPGSSAPLRPSSPQRFW